MFNKLKRFFSRTRTRSPEQPAPRGIAVFGIDEPVALNGNSLQEQFEDLSRRWDLHLTDCASHGMQMPRCRATLARARVIASERDYHGALKELLKAGNPDVSVVRT
jgi:hypothetical protein